MYPGVHEQNIRNYLKNLAIKTDILSGINIRSTDSLFDFSKFISENLLPSDSSSLQFSTPKKGILNSVELSKFDSLNSIAEKLYDIYFHYYYSLSANIGDIELTT